MWEMEEVEEEGEGEEAEVEEEEEEGDEEKDFALFTSEVQCPSANLVPPGCLSAWQLHPLLWQRASS